eukprot:GHVT01063935.1.p2 GENE.GHVT01063935.1~~GHVT01063935.1.p2  ORF type:complete len:162 (-),score=7.03 GHVT01063935.1:148-633(-)
MPDRNGVRTCRKAVGHANAKIWKFSISDRLDVAGVRRQPAIQPSLLRFNRISDCWRLRSLNKYKELYQRKQTQAAKDGPCRTMCNGSQVSLTRGCPFVGPAFWLNIVLSYGRVASLLSWPSPFKPAAALCKDASNRARPTTVGRSPGMTDAPARSLWTPMV